MKTSRTWHGVRMRDTSAAAEPDAPPRAVTLPAIWDAVGGRRARRAGPGQPARRGWRKRPRPGSRRSPGVPRAPASRPRSANGSTPCCSSAARRRAPPSGAAKRAPPCFVLNLAAFHDPLVGLDLAGLAEAIDTVSIALSLLPERGRRMLAAADLAGLLAALGLDYDSDAARDTAPASSPCCAAGSMRGSAAARGTGRRRRRIARCPSSPPPPAPRMSRRSGRGNCRSPRPTPGIATAILPPGPDGGAARRRDRRHRARLLAARAREAGSPARRAPSSPPAASPPRPRSPPSSPARAC